jgi:hypothetical protein
MEDLLRQSSSLRVLKLCDRDEDSLSWILLLKEKKKGKKTFIVNERRKRKKKNDFQGLLMVLCYRLHLPCSSRVSKSFLCCPFHTTNFAALPHDSWSQFPSLVNL